MSRLKLWFFTFLGIMAFVVTLAVVATPLAIVPIGFSVIYLPGLAFSLFLAWAVTGVKWGNALVMLATCAFFFTGFLVMGSPLAAFTALVITIAVYSVHKRTNREKVTKAQVEAYLPELMRMQMSYAGVRVSHGAPVEHAARQVR